jgi:hypothetical protein
MEATLSLNSQSDSVLVICPSNNMSYSSSAAFQALSILRNTSVPSARQT